jgi:tRNA(adenine34) deaminase
MLSRNMQEKLIRISMDEAEKAIARGDDPFGGVIADKEGNIIVRDGNRENTEMNRAAHAEMVLIREACKKLKTTDLSGYISVCNAESCPMCSSALILSGIDEFYFGMKMGHDCNPYLPMDMVTAKARQACTVVGGILEEECTEVVMRGWRLREKDRQKE